jgi:hypothetical protein
MDSLMRKVKINQLQPPHSKHLKIKNLKKQEKFNLEELNQLLEEKNKLVNLLVISMKVLMILMMMET